MMKCPMSFANPDERGAWSDCDERCAWLIESKNGTYACAIAFLASKEAFGYAVKNIVDRGA